MALQVLMKYILKKVDQVFKFVSLCILWQNTCLSKCWDDKNYEVLVVLIMIALIFAQGKPVNRFYLFQTYLTKNM